jgi:beta-galactosidase
MRSRKILNIFLVSMLHNLLFPNTLSAFHSWSNHLSEDPLLASRYRSFNSGWKFIHQDLSGAEIVNYDDSKWTKVNLPHDYSMINTHQGDNIIQIGPFNKKSVGGPFTGYTEGGVGWYRKTFTLNRADKNKIVKIHFDGVYSESEVWLNGKKLGYHPHGYTPFYYDLTPFLSRPGIKNVLSVKTRNIGENSRWYAGSGIYRYVHLTVTNPVHIATWGIVINTESIIHDRAMVKMAIRVENSGASRAQLSIKSEIIDEHDHITATKTTKLAVNANTDGVSNMSVGIKKPLLWTTMSPHQYAARISVSVDGALIDQYTQSFGIRTLAFTAKDGFKLNGETLLLKGANIHQDNGLLGAKAYRRAEERKVELLKANGFNAIRTSHNPPSTAFLDACDKLGMLVVNEVFDMWEHPKKPQDYHQYFKEWAEKDLTNTILRDRNHPSVIMWSIGNEIYERASPRGVEIAERLVNLSHKLDVTRPVTAGVCDFWDHKGMEWDSTANAFKHLDVAGYNYKQNKYLEDHHKYPSRIIMGTESFAMEAFDNWEKLKQMPWVIGDFVWTGMDYIGEAGIGHSLIDKKAEGNLLAWPWYNAWCGDLDITGIKKPQSFYRDVVWERSNLEIAVRTPLNQGSTEIISDWGWPEEQQNWNWPEFQNKELTVAVYSRAEKVRIELNGKIIAEKLVSEAAKLITLFRVPYQPGTLKVTAFSNGRELDTRTLKTVGPPAAIRLVSDRKELNCSDDDLAYVRIEVIDKDGNRVSNAAIPISLKIKGNGRLEASGNAGPTDLQSFRNPHLTTYHGKALAIIQTNGKVGEIELSAEAEGLTMGRAELNVHVADNRSIQD